MSVVTVLCHGTGRSQVAPQHAKSGELISWLGNHLAGTKANVAYDNASKKTTYTIGDFVINEGPGHDDPNAILPQNFTPDGKVLPQSLGQQKYGNVTGSGWTENVERTVGIIKEMGKTTVVNLSGWSRGAVTCIRIANALRKDLATQHITCNIFAVDPVAGAGQSKTSGVSKLGKNVANYVAILAMHERGSWFKPQDFSRLSILDKEETKVCMLPFPGLHSTLVTIKDPVDTAEIVRTLAVRFLETHGTKFQNIQVPAKTGSAEEMCVRYARLIRYLSPNEGDKWQTSFKESLKGRGTLKRRSFNTHSKMDLYTHGGKDSYWINEHHEYCFKKAFGAVYDALPQGSRANANASAKQELLKLYGAYPEVFQSLWNKGFIAGNAGGEFVYEDKLVYARETGNELKPGTPGRFPLF